MLQELPTAIGVHTGAAEVHGVICQRNDAPGRAVRHRRHADLKEIVRRDLGLEGADVEGPGVEHGLGALSVRAALHLVLQRHVHVELHGFAESVGSKGGGCTARIPEIGAVRPGVHAEVGRVTGVESHAALHDFVAFHLGQHLGVLQERLIGPLAVGFPLGWIFQASFGEEILVEPNLFAVAEPRQAVYLALVLLRGGFIEVIGRNVGIRGQIGVEVRDDLGVDERAQPCKIAVNGIEGNAARLRRAGFGRQFTEARAGHGEIQVRILFREGIEDVTPGVLPDLILGQVDVQVIDDRGLHDFGFFGSLFRLFFHLLLGRSFLHHLRLTASR